MKKIITILILAVVAGAVFYSCKKDKNETATPQTSGVSVIGNRLAFNSVTDYENYETTLGNNPITGTGIKASKDTLIDDAFLASILNEDNIVQIAGKLYLLDFAAEMCYVSSDLSQAGVQNLMAKNIANGGVKAYDFSTDVLYLDEDTASEATMKKCHDKGTPKDAKNNKIDHHTKWPTFVGDYGLDDGTIISSACLKPEAEQAYRRYAIHFTLKASFKYYYKKNYGSIAVCGEVFYKDAPSLIYMSYSYKFQRKCKGEESGAFSNQSNINNPGSHNNKFTWTFYHGSKALSRYDLNTEFSYTANGYTAIKVIRTAVPDELIYGY